jgi:hypothetical protein
MAILLAGNTAVGETDNGSFNVVSVTSNGYIEIPDTVFSVNANANAFISATAAGVTINNAMWSWWIKPLILRDKNASNHWTYACFTQSNGAVGVSITNHNTAVSTQYTITPANAFSKDDHNASAVVTGNNKAYIFIQGRTANANILNPNNMYYLEFSEGESPAGKTLTNVTFSTAPTATASFYPNAFNANGKFILLGRQQTAATANQWLAVIGDYPVSNLSTPKGLFRSTYTWPYFALRRSFADRDVINFALGWHPYDSTSNNNIYFGKILRNGNTGPWDVYSNNSVVGNLTTGAGLPLSEANLELVFTNTGGNNSVRLFDSHDDAVAFGTFDKKVNKVQYKMAYKIGGTWRTKLVCDGGNPFHGVQVRDYYGGMAISERDKFTVTVSAEFDNQWEIREYKSTDSGNNWILVDATQANQYEVAGRPMDEVLSEDSHINNYTGQLGSFSWFGTYDGTDFTTFSTNIASTRLLSTNRGDTSIGADQRGYFSSIDTLNSNGYFEVLSPGLSFGYAAGGLTNNPSPTTTNIIEKYPFAADANATDVADLTSQIRGAAGISSPTNGYVAAGQFSTSILIPRTTTNVDRFPFAADVNATSIGNLTYDVIFPAGHQSTIHGYKSGGQRQNVGGNSAGWVATIEKFSFAADLVATTIVGDLTVARYGAAGQSSTTHGYASGGGIPPPPAIPNVTTIDKFPFSSDTNATFVGDLSQARRIAGPQYSTTHGYASGGGHPAGPVFYSDVIDKFPFSADSNATDIANLSQARRVTSGQSSTTHGYTAGGADAPVYLNTIDKFPFSADANATDVGDLTQTKTDPTGLQG